MSKGPFLASEFVATKFSSAAEKAEFGSALLKFLGADCAPGLFTNKLYQRLSMTFAHIAHDNRSQFYEEWFASLSGQVRFLEHTLRFPATEVRNSRFRMWRVRFSGRSATGIIFCGIRCSSQKSNAGRN